MTASVCLPTRWSSRAAALGSALALFIAASSPAAAQPAPLEGFEAYVTEAVEAWEVPGLAIAVVKDGEVVYSDAFGVRELGSDAPVTERTLFAIGSTTKAMTAAALGMLVDEGRIGWDDPVIEHLPHFRLSDPYVTREITIRDLLTHRAGLGNADFLWYEQDATAAEIVHRIRYAEPAYSLRASFIYQNIMYATAGAVIEAASGQSWASFVQSRIFDPLGMTGTVPTMETLHAQPDVASPHDRIDGTVEVIENASVDPVAAAGSVWSSVHDMSLWMRFLLDGGVSADGERLLREETVAELFEPQAIVPRRQFYPTTRLTEPKWTTYGLGWFQHDYQGRAVDFHTGSIDGMVAIHGLILDEDLGVYVLANRDHAEVRHALMYRVFDLFGDGPGRDWSEDLLELFGDLAKEAEQAQVELKASRVEGTRPSLPLEAYAGSYEDPLYGSIDVRVGVDGLRVVYGPGLQGDASHWHYDTFQVAWDARWRGESLITFDLGPDGQVASLTMNGAEFPRVEEES